MNGSERGSVRTYISIRYALAHPVTRANRKGLTRLLGLNIIPRQYYEMCALHLTSGYVIPGADVFLQAGQKVVRWRAGNWGGGEARCQMERCGIKNASVPSCACLRRRRFFPEFPVKGVCQQRNILSGEMGTLENVALES